jgi:phenylpropionate dioxygenase-like ring-hydroxylating dioxygenase large terminal subunit
MQGRRQLCETLRAQVAGEASAVHEPFAVAAQRYLDPVRCAREQAVFARRPRIGAASSEIAPGACLPAGDDTLITRDREDGAVRAFANACRHRGTRLTDAPCAKAIVCPYHGWTYDLRGSLIHVPHEGTFGGMSRGRNLRARPVVERDGLVWLGELDAAWLAPIADDLAAMQLSRHILWKRGRTVRRCNWKLVIEAFLDGYHIRVRHRSSIYRFFIDAASAAERAGEHIRAVTARRALAEAATLEGVDLRTLATPSYYVFPGTVIIEHPDFVSIINVAPLSPGETSWEHMMLVPAERAGEAEHWERSWALIDEGGFQREDLWVCEQAQRGLAATPGDDLVFGSLKHAVRWFYAALDTAVDQLR